MPLGGINISKVCPPYLHILLSIVKNHHDLLEEELHEIDLRIASEIEMAKAKLDNIVFHVYIHNLGKKRQIGNQLGYQHETTNVNSELTKNEA